MGAELHGIGHRIPHGTRFLPPPPLAGGEQVHFSKVTQNTVAFVQALYLVLQENGEPATKDRLLKPLVKAIESVP
jgi:hypothetical protein